MVQEKLSFYETSGTSMWPFLKAGEKLVIKKTPVENLRPGDIILYRADNQLVCHRLVRKIKRGTNFLLYARGDGSTSLPELVTKDRLIGQAVIAIRKGRHISLIGPGQRFMNRLIALMAPFIIKGIRIIMPYRNRFRHG